MDNSQAIKTTDSTVPVVIADEVINLFVSFTQVNSDTEKATIVKKIVARNQKLILYVINKYYNNKKKFRDLREDLIQEGNIGLLAAIKGFDYTRGYKFSTYAIWWIRQAINNFLMNSSDTIRTPAHIVGLRGKFTKTLRTFEKDNGRQPETNELAYALGVTEETIQSIRQALKNQNVQSMDEPVSLHAKGFGGGTHDSDTLHSLIPTPKSNSDSESQMFTKVLVQAVKKAMGNLSSRELIIIKLRYGIIKDPCERNECEFSSPTPSVDTVEASENNTESLSCSLEVPIFSL